MMKTSNLVFSPQLISAILHQWAHEPRSAPARPAVMLASTYEIATLTDGRVEVKQRTYDGRDWRTMRRLYRRQGNRVQRVFKHIEDAHAAYEGLHESGEPLMAHDGETLETTIRRTLRLPGNTTSDASEAAVQTAAWLDTLARHHATSGLVTDDIRELYEHLLDPHADAEAVRLSNLLDDSRV
jgi:hypothetical protein